MKAGEVEEERIKEVEQNKQGRRDLSGEGQAKSRDDDEHTG